MTGLRAVAGVTVHGAIDPADHFTFVVPVPPSVNAMYYNDKKGGRGRSEKYETWRKEASRELLMQRIKAVRGAVSIKVTIRDSGEGDLDNRLKALLDFCVHHGIIRDDRREVVRRIEIAWGMVPGAKVEIVSVAG